MKMDHTPVKPRRPVLEDRYRQGTAQKHTKRLDYSPCRAKVRMDRSAEPKQRRRRGDRMSPATTRRPMKARGVVTVSKIAEKLKP